MKDKIIVKGHLLRVFLLIAALAAAPLPALPAQAKVKLNQTSLTMAVGSTYQLKVSGTKKKVTYKSSNTKVATVTSKGKIKAKKAGTATITATVNRKKYKCKVTVLKKSAYNAYTLRQFILKYGTKSKGEPEYYIENRYLDDSDSNITYRITATPDKYGKKLTFFYQLTPDTATPDYSFSMSIDLVNKTRGTASYSSIDQADDTGYAGFGDITTAFNGSTAGFTCTRYVTYDFGIEGEIVPSEQPATTLSAYNEALSKSIAATFKGFNTLLKKNFKKKKTGVTMQSIGFSKVK